MPDRLEEIARELHRVPPAEFVAARNARAAAEDGDLAARIRGLRRPAPAAWIVNLLAGERREDLAALAELGDEARAAQRALDRDSIGRLARRRREVIRSLVEAGATLATAVGHAANAAARDGVERTLEAATADPDAATAVLSGLLVRPIETVGFEPADLDGALALGPASEAPRPPRPRLRRVDDPDAELERARHVADDLLDTARQAARDAAAELGEADTRLGRLTTEREALEGEVASLESRLADARRRLTAAEREVRAAERERERVVRAAERAREALDRATQRRVDLG